jgi:ribosome-interacting GTPase 1
VTDPDDDLKTELARLKEENERLKSRTGRGMSLKVSEKGALSVYGLGRFPVTLYKEQWQKLLGMADEIREFLKENDERLKSKS